MVKPGQPEAGNSCKVKDRFHGMVWSHPLRIPIVIRREKPKERNTKYRMRQEEILSLYRLKLLYDYLANIIKRYIHSKQILSSLAKQPRTGYFDGNSSIFCKLSRFQFLIHNLPHLRSFNASAYGSRQCL